MYAPIPDGQVNILRGVPIDPEYKHTLYWTDAASQKAYFSDCAKKTYDRMIYIRETGRLRAPCCSDDIDDCNYLMYRNLQYVDKWFYAFIKQVYYINDNCCEIEFEIDVMQSYFFDIDIKQSYIERNHTVTDEIGDNRVDENLNIGGYYTMQSEALFADASSQVWDIIAYSTFDLTTFQSSGGSLVNGMYSALERTKIGSVRLMYDGATMTGEFILDPRPTIQDLVNNHADKIDGLIAIVLAPALLETNAILEKNVQKPKYGDTLGGIDAESLRYRPRNAKLYTFPYCGIYVTDGTGQGKLYAYEDFIGDNKNAKFKIFSDRAPAQSVLVAPVGYKGYSPTNYGNSVNFEEALVISAFPQCAWLSDTFQTYLAQNQTSIGVSSAIGALQLIGGAALTVASEGAAAPVGIGMMTGGATAIAKTLVDLSDKSRIPPRANGNITGTAFYSVGKKTGSVIRMCGRPDYLKIIDDYFTVYGYAIKSVGVPNISARPHWNYIKTVDACILPVSGGGLPSSALGKIIQIFDRGVTFWKNPDEVGNYSLNNRPL